MDLMPLLVDAMLAPHTLVRSQVHAARPALEETADGWLISCALPGLGLKDVSVETSRDAEGDAHLWLHALRRLETEFRCVRAARHGHPPLDGRALLRRAAPAVAATRRAARAQHAAPAW
jgi:hypothetical protein